MIKTSIISVMITLLSEGAFPPHILLTLQLRLDETCKDLETYIKGILLQVESSDRHLSNPRQKENTTTTPGKNNRQSPSELSHDCIVVVCGIGRHPGG